MQCQLKDQDEAMAVFQQIFQSQHCTAEPILECFNVLVQSEMYEVALQLGGHLLKACEKFVCGVEMQKKFVLKFLFVFDCTLKQQKPQQVKQN